jgi:hypothetical protein
MRRFPVQYPSGLIEWLPLEVFTVTTLRGTSVVEMVNVEALSWPHAAQVFLAHRPDLASWVEDGPEHRISIVEKTSK